jgi:hypothetical protein
MSDADLLRPGRGCTTDRQLEHDGMIRVPSGSFRVGPDLLPARGTLEGHVS